MECRERYPDLPTLLASVRQRPAMWLSRKSIRGLHLFLDGIRFAEAFHALAESARFGGFDVPGFERWVAGRYNPRRLAHNSYSLAAELAGSEEGGFDLWFGWYDEFAGGGSQPSTPNQIE